MIGRGSWLSGVGATALALCCLSGCDRTLDEVREGTVLQQLHAPNGMMEAYVSKVKTGERGYSGTSARPFQVFINNYRSSSVHGAVVLAAQRTDGLRVGWVDDHRLIICYADADIFYFKNRYAFARKNEPPLDTVEIILRRVNNLEQCHRP